MSEALIETKESPTEATVERTRSKQTYSPRFDVWETDDELVLYGDLPGVLHGLKYAAQKRRRTTQ